MRCVMPYTPSGIAARAGDALLAQAPDAELVDVSGSPTAYHVLLERLWADQQDFMLVEHDNVIAPGTVAALEACPWEWCACPHTPLSERWAHVCNPWGGIDKVPERQLVRLRCRGVAAEPQHARERHRLAVALPLGGREPLLPQCVRDGSEVACSLACQTLGTGYQVSLRNLIRLSIPTVLRLPEYLSPRPVRTHTAEREHARSRAAMPAGRPRRSVAE